MFSKVLVLAILLPTVLCTVASGPIINPSGRYALNELQVSLGIYFSWPISISNSQLLSKVSFDDATENCKKLGSNAELATLSSSASPDIPDLKETLGEDSQSSPELWIGGIIKGNEAGCLSSNFRDVSCWNWIVDGVPRPMTVNDIQGIPFTQETKYANPRSRLILVKNAGGDLELSIGNVADTQRYLCDTRP